MEQDKSDLRIGELLIEAQILRARELSDAIKIAKLTSLPIGRILVMSSYVTEPEFQAAVEAQSLVRDAMIPLKTAISALSRMYRNESSWQEALKEIGWVAAAGARTNKLGELLQEAEIITSTQFDRAMETGRDTSLPLGRVLVSLGSLSEQSLATALNTQILIRDGKITREQGIAGLKAAYQRRMPVELALLETGFYRGPVKQSIRLGELFTLCGLLSSEDVMNALELALTQGKPIGEMLIEKGLITGHLLSTALTLQEMVSNRTLDHAQAAQCLFKIYKGELLDGVLSELEVIESDFKITVRYHDVLRVAGLLQHSDIELTELRSGLAPSTADALRSAKRLLQNGFIDQRTYYGSLRCYFLMACGWLSIQQGIIALNYFAHKEHLSFDEILLDLDWTVRTQTRRATKIKEPAPTEKQ